MSERVPKVWLETGTDDLFVSDSEKSQALKAALQADVVTNAEPLKNVLNKHIVDVLPHSSGNKEKLKGIIGDSFGTVDIEILRAEPSIKTGAIHLPRGASKVLVGRNGSGKSTFLDAVMERDGAFMSTAKYNGAFNYAEPVHARESLRIARLNQEEIMIGIESMSAGEVLEKSAEYFKDGLPIDWSNNDLYEQNLANQDAHIRIDALAHQVAAVFGIGEFAHTQVSQLSGGEKTKLALFMLILSEPDILLLDEPTNHLDLQSISLLTALYKQYQTAGVSILSASHVGWFLEEASRDGVVAANWNNKGRTISSFGTSYDKYIKNPNLDAVPIIDGDIDWLQKDYWYKQGEIIINSKNHLSIADSPIQNIHMPSLIGGDLVVLTGNNGSGKTKLFTEIIYGHNDLSKEKGVNAAYLPQFWPEEVASGTVGEFFEWIKSIANPHTQSSAEHNNQPAVNLFTKLVNQKHFAGLTRTGEGWLKRPLSTFSGGEQRLLWFLAVTAIPNIDLLLLDEPTNHMDSVCQELIARAIKKFPGAVLLASHDKILMKDIFEDKELLRSKRTSHWLMTKQNGQSQLAPTDVNPIDYYARVQEDAKKLASQIKV